MKFIRNGWYVAGWSEELVRTRPLARTLLDQPVVLFRDQQGRASALLDQCPHRLAPLSKGKLLATGLQCPYHGLQFDGQGKCTHNPFGPQPPPRARVQAFRIEERNGIAWIWTGDADHADTTLIPDFSIIDDTATWNTARGYLLSPANYQLGIDNLMDLSHPEFLHDSSLGSPALRSAQYQVAEESSRIIHSNRWFDEGPIPPVMERMFSSGGRPVSHWANMRWEAPSSLWLHTGICWPGQPRSGGMNAYTAHLLTPETSRSTHYFFAIVRSAEEVRRLGDGQAVRDMVGKIFETEDSPMLADIQQRMGDADLWDFKLASLPGDAGSVRVRQAIRKLLDAEDAIAV